jgi:hypothetical protein
METQILFWSLIVFAMTVWLMTAPSILSLRIKARVIMVLPIQIDKTDLFLAGSF